MSEVNTEPATRAGGALRPYLELVRPPALLTASADSLAGWAWVMASFALVKVDGDQPIHHLREFVLTQPLWGVGLTTLLLMATSTMIYAAGMATNDLFDYQEDLRDRPFRPLPSGRISLKSAWCFALSLQVGALLLLSVALIYLWEAPSPWPLCLAVFTIAMTYLYNKVFKNSVIAPLFMGLCRWGNFWIGGSLALLTYTEMPQILHISELQLPLYASVGTLLYVTSLTALSRYEVRGGHGARVWASALIILSTHPLWWHLSLNSPVVGSNFQVALLLVTNVLCTLWLCQKLSGVLREPSSASKVQAAVGAGIRGVALTNVCLCLMFGAWPLGVLILALAFNAGLVARWFYAT